MIKHILLCQLADSLTAEERRGIQTDVKNGLERLPGRIPGLVSVNVSIDPLDTSNADIYLEATMTDVSALRVYQDHPEHVKVKEILAPAMSNRIVMDYEVSDWNAENIFRDR